MVNVESVLVQLAIVITDLVTQTVLKIQTNYIAGHLWERNV
jgi:hypothetical protein